MRIFKQASKYPKAAFTLIEILMVAAILSTVTAGAVFTLGNIRRAADNTKLQRDVIVVNNAIRLYMMNGGTFIKSDLASPATLLAKIKSRATDESAKQLAGLRHSMADERLTFEMQTAAEAATGEQRARFVPDLANPRFIIQSKGPPGIRRFVLDASLAQKDYGKEERTVNMKLAKKDPWVWDYNDAGPRRATPDLPPRTDPGLSNPNPPDQGNLTLNPPDFSIDGGTAPLLSYPRTLALIPTNPSGTAQIHYSVNSGPFIPYQGPLTIDPGQTVTGISISLDPDRYDDSPSRNESYKTTPVTPWPFMVFNQNKYTYFELGGEAAPGTPPPLPSGSVTGSGYVLNLLLIPRAYQNSGVFRYTWTTDGTSPLSSSTAQVQPDFSGGFTTAAIPLPLSAFGKRSSVTVKSAVKAENKEIVNDSAVISRTIDAEAIDLRAPRITIDGRDVTLSINLAPRDTPKGVRIYYTTDGTNPGLDAAGNPQRGTLYTGMPFTLSGTTGSNLTVTARAYAPLDYPQFFNASAAASTTLVLPAPTEVYVGGNFMNSSGVPLRNIARLNNSGQVDLRFNTGSGASDDSLVGIVRQTGSGVVAGGDFESMNGSPRQGFVRLNADGSVDNTFDADLSAN